MGDEFVALTPAGTAQEPSSVMTLDDKLFSVRFDPPLAGGEIGLRWSVQAADSHPIEGAFSFSVNAPSATTPAPSTTPDEAPTTVPAAAADATPTTEAATDGSAASSQSLDEFLTVDESTPGETTATVGRVVALMGVAIGIGAFAFVGTALRGRRDEVSQAINAIRLLGAVIALGAAIEYVGVGRIGGESLVSTWSTAPGFATILRIVGGLGLAFGLAGTISRGRVQRVVRRPSVVRSLSAAVVDDLAPARTTEESGSPIVRWTPDARSWPSIGGVVLIVASFWFDGHTVSKGFRPLHALVNSVHVAAWRRVGRRCRRPRRGGVGPPSVGSTDAGGRARRPVLEDRNGRACFGRGRGWCHGVAGARLVR